MTMQKLNVRFSDEMKDEIQQLSCEIGGSFSDIARSAMEEGLFQLKEGFRMSKLINNDSEWSRGNEIYTPTGRKIAVNSGKWAIDGDEHLQEDLLK